MSAPRGLYTPIYGSLPRHPKTVAAAVALKVSRHQLIGHLVCLWTWCLDSVSEDRQVLSAEVVALAAEWPEKRAQGFADALADVGFLHRTAGGFEVHEWGEYGGKVAAKQRRDRDRKRDEPPEPPPSFHGSSAEPPPHFQRDSGVDETRSDETRRDDPDPPLQLQREVAFKALTLLVSDACGWIAPSVAVSEQLLDWARDLSPDDVSQIRKEADDAKARSPGGRRGNAWSLIKTIAGRVAVERREGRDPWASPRSSMGGGGPGGGGNHAGARGRGGVRGGDSRDAGPRDGPERDWRGLELPDLSWITAAQQSRAANEPSSDTGGSPAA